MDFLASVTCVPANRTERNCIAKLVVKSSPRLKRIYWHISQWWRLRCLELRIFFCKTRIICLKCGYLAPNKPNLASNRVFCRAAISHPIEVINILLESCHIVWCDMVQPKKLKYHKV